MTETTHDNCTTCEWLAREAERTAKRTAIGSDWDTATRNTK